MVDEISDNRWLMRSVTTQRLLGACATYADVLFDYIAGLASSQDTGGASQDTGGANGADSSEPGSLRVEDYVKAGKSVMRLMNFPQQMAFFFSVFSRRKGSLNREEGLVMLHTCCTLGYYCAGVSTLSVAADDVFLVAMWDSLRGGEEVVSVESATTWCSRHCPGIWDAVHLCTRLALFGGHSIGLEGALPHPDLLQTVDEGDSLLSPSILWVLSTVLPSVYVPPSKLTGDNKAILGSHLPLSKVLTGSNFHLMYSSNDHGLSTNRFNHHVFSYNAPTLMFVSFDRHLYCVAVDSEWREGVKRWGGGDCQLIQLLPVFKSLQSGSGLLYFNTLDRRMPKQLQVGVDVKRLPLQIDAGFSSVKHYSVDVPLERLEVWGCGGESILKDQLSQKQWEQKEADKQKNRKLKIDDWNDNPDKELLNMGGITTDHAER
ncbi:hypothetical protein NP493_568g00003 [Ridgeia piscesae]|uniref:TLDc domain-containing protein n=1 Tax=Ridgeia piscesae TaxID=27915 RepID=A0AAD9KW59_RIDPI|nr:hypothetical protein NP493_568g00003 [Ridgeia piscesae]